MNRAYVSPSPTLVPAVRSGSSQPKYSREADAELERWLREDVLSLNAEFYVPLEAEGPQLVEARPAPKVETVPAAA